MAGGVRLARAVLCLFGFGFLSVSEYSLVSNDAMIRGCSEREMGKTLKLGKQNGKTSQHELNVRPII